MVLIVETSAAVMDLDWSLALTDNLIAAFAFESIQVDRFFNIKATVSK